MAHDSVMADKVPMSEELEKISLKPIKGSKKSKKSWRKHADICDVEDYMEGVRRDERTGGPVDDKPDSALFFVEKDLDQTDEKAGRKKKKKKSTTEIEVDDDDEVYVPRRKKLDDRLRKEAELLQNKIAEARTAKVQTIWGQDIMTVTDSYLDSTVKKPKVKPKTIGTGKSDMKAVNVADGGASYNPDYDSHQALLMKAHDKEMKIALEQEKFNKTVKMISVSKLKKQSKLWLEEMSEGLSQATEESQDDNDGSQNVVFQQLVSIKNRKTSQQRRKQAQIKKMTRLRLEAKQKKVRLNDILRLKSLKKEIALSNTLKEPVEEMEKKSVRRPKRLSRYKFVESRINVKLSEELKGSLRELKPEGCLIRDRFKSLQRRNIIETRNKVLPRRRYRRKDIVRRSYKSSTV